MAGVMPLHPLLLLGATGKVGRMLRNVWPGPAPLVTVGRSGDVMHRWWPGQPTGALPGTPVIAAFWGVVPGSGGDLEENTTLAIAAMRLGEVLGAPIVIHCSSAAVYAPDAALIGENTPPEPRNAYGRAKAAMERAVLDWAEAHPGGPRPVILRIGNVAGAESLFGAMAGASTVTLDRFADGTGPARSYIAPSDLARVVAALAAADPAELPTLLNVGAPTPTGMADIASAAGRGIEWRAAPDEAVPLLALDVSRLLEICPLGPEAADPIHLVADWRRATGADGGVRA